MTIVEDTRAITGGVDTHADTHVAAALDPLGGLPGVREFPASAAGYADLLDWLDGFGTIALAGVEGTGSYGAGLARHLAAAGIKVVEVDRADRQDRHRPERSLTTWMPHPCCWNDVDVASTPYPPEAGASHQSRQRSRSPAAPTAGAGRAPLDHDQPNRPQAMPSKSPSLTPARK